MEFYIILRLDIATVTIIPQQGTKVETMGAGRLQQCHKWAAQLLQTEDIVWSTKDDQLLYRTRVAGSGWTPAFPSSSPVSQSNEDSEERR